MGAPITRSPLKIHVGVALLSPILIGIAWSEESRFGMPARAELSSISEELI